MGIGWDFHLAQEAEAYYGGEDCPECGSYVRHPNKYQWVCSNQECDFEYDKREGQVE